MPAKPTALVWETDEKFYVGLGNGCFFHCQIDLKGNKLVEISANRSFGGCGGFPVMAMALDSECKTMGISVGPGVYVMRRESTAGMFHSLMDQGVQLMSPKRNFVLPQACRACSIL